MFYRVLFIIGILFISHIVHAQMLFSREFMLTSVPRDPDCVEALQLAEKAIHDNPQLYPEGSYRLVALSFIDEQVCQVYNIIDFRDPENPLLSPHEAMEQLFEIWRQKRILHSYEHRENGLVWILREFPPSDM